MSVSGRDIAENTRVNDNGTLQNNSDTSTENLSHNGRNFSLPSSSGSDSVITRVDASNPVKGSFVKEVENEDILKIKSARVIVGSATSTQGAQAGGDDDQQLFDEVLQVDEARAPESLDLRGQSEVVDLVQIQDNVSVAEQSMPISAQSRKPEVESTSKKTEHAVQSVLRQENQIPSLVSSADKLVLSSQSEGFLAKMEFVAEAGIQKVQALKEQGSLSTSQIQELIKVAAAVHHVEDIGTLFIRMKDGIVHTVCDSLQSKAHAEDYIKNNQHLDVFQGAKEIKSAYVVSPEDFKILQKAAEQRIAELDKQKKAKQHEGGEVQERRVSVDNGKRTENVKDENIDDLKLELLSIELLHSLLRDSAKKIDDSRRQFQEAEKKKDEIADEKKLTNLKQDIYKEEIKRELLLKEVNKREVEKQKHLRN